MAADGDAIAENTGGAGEMPAGDETGSVVTAGSCAGSCALTGDGAGTGRERGNASGRATGDVTHADTVIAEQSKVNRRSVRTLVLSVSVP